MSDSETNVTNRASYGAKNLNVFRFGKIYRGNKMQNFEKAGAIGAILFSDPDEVAAE